ncbi:hypothetical protein EV424DRAFT_1548364 [Suillus variegatus]|nr:hypothetical protein EV424DRAFT_1548364 [Suillus variegatus]
MEMALAQYVQPLQTIGRSGLETMAEWTWWDELTIGDKQADPQAIINTIEDESVQEQHKLESRLTLKQTHTDTIQKLINYVANLPCAKSSSSLDALMSADVSIGLEYLVRGLFLNTSRTRVRAVYDDPSKKFNVSTDVEALNIIFPQCEADKFTMGYDDEYEDPEDHAEMEFKNPRNKGKVKEIEVSDKAHVPPTIRQTPASGSKPPVSNVPTTLDGQPRPVPKPRPVPRKTHNAPSTSEVTVHPSSGQHDKNPNVESEASANNQTRSSPPAVATVACAGDMSDQPTTPTQAKVVSMDPDAMTVDEDCSNQHGQCETPEPQDDTSGSQPEHSARMSFKQAMIEDHIIEDNRATPRPADRPLDNAETDVNDPSQQHGSASTTVAKAYELAFSSSAPSRLTSVSQESLPSHSDTSSGTLPPLTPGDDILDGDGFATNDIDWFNAEFDDGKREHGPGEDKDYDDGPDEDASSEDRMSGTDNPHDASKSASATVPWADVHGSLPSAYTPTQPLTQPLPARQHERRILPASSTKRARAATGTSSLSSTHGGGKKQQKKAKVMLQSDDDEADDVLIPI